MSKLQEEKRKRGSTNVSEVIPQVLATSLFSSFSFPRKKKKVCFLLLDASEGFPLSYRSESL